MNRNDGPLPDGLPTHLHEFIETEGRQLPSWTAPGKLAGDPVLARSHQPGQGR